MIELLETECLLCFFYFTQFLFLSHSLRFALSAFPFLPLPLSPSSITCWPDHPVDLTSNEKSIHLEHQIWWSTLFLISSSLSINFFPLSFFFPTIHLSILAPATCLTSALFLCISSSFSILMFSLFLVSSLLILDPWNFFHQICNLKPQWPHQWTNTNFILNYIASFTYWLTFFLDKLNNQTKLVLSCWQKRSFSLSLSLSLSLCSPVECVYTRT